MTRFHDHFSGHAGAYAAHRPTYPRSLFAFLDRVASSGGWAWDVATGSGQAASALGSLGRRVIATDASARQIEHARNHPEVGYVVALAERAPFPGGSVSLVTVAQALHWFDVPRFYDEVRRVLAPGGVLAVWTYDLFQTTESVDAVVDRLYRDTVGSYWPLERRHIESCYGTLPFPFERIVAGPFQMEESWSLDQVLGYLSTWSAVRRYMGATGLDPVAALAPELRAAWGASERRLVRWPLTVMAGTVAG